MLEPGMDGEVECEVGCEVEGLALSNKPDIIKIVIELA